MSELKDMPKVIWIRGRTAYLSDCSVSSCNVSENTVVLAKDDPTCTRYTRADLAERGWKPIESAPRDGSYFLVYRPNAKIKQVFVAMFSRYLGLKLLNGPLAKNVTHWQPLPQPPKDGAEDE